MQWLGPCVASEKKKVLVSCNFSRDLSSSLVFVLHQALFWREPLFFDWRAPLKLDHVVAQGLWFINTSLLCQCEHPADEAVKGDNVIAPVSVWIGS